MQLLFIPLAALIITQFIKVVIDWLNQRPASMNVYGGMPSAHSAMFAALVLMAGLREGVQSFDFAISVILYLVMVRDAVGIRQHLGSHSAILKRLIQEHYKDHAHNIPHDKIVTRLGHTPLQAAVGTVCGIVITLLLYWIVN